MVIIKIIFSRKIGGPTPPGLSMTVQTLNQAQASKENDYVEEYIYFSSAIIVTNMLPNNK